MTSSSWQGSHGRGSPQWPAFDPWRQSDPRYQEPAHRMPDFGSIIQPLPKRQRRSPPPVPLGFVTPQSARRAQARHPHQAAPDTAAALPPLRAPPAFQPKPGLPTVGSIHRASTGDSHRYGIFVKLPGYTLRGLVPVHAAADSIGVLGIQDPELRQQALHFLMPPGTQAWVKVESHRTKSDGSQVYACSMNAVSQADGTDLESAQSDQPEAQGQPDVLPMQVDDHSLRLASDIRIGRRFRGRIKAVFPFGAFVQVGSLPFDALLPLKQVSSEKQFQIAIRSFSEDDKLAAILHVIQVGQWVLAKVMEYVPGQPKPLRFTCSLRDVSQLDGSDFMQQDKAQLKDGAAVIAEHFGLGASCDDPLPEELDVPLSPVHDPEYEQLGQPDGKADQKADDEAAQATEVLLSELDPDASRKVRKEKKHKKEKDRGKSSKKAKKESKETHKT